MHDLDGTLATIATAIGSAAERIATAIEAHAAATAGQSNGSEHGADNAHKVQRNLDMAADRAAGVSWADLAAKYGVSEARCRNITNAVAARAA